MRRRRREQTPSSPPGPRTKRGPRESSSTAATWPTRPLSLFRAKFEVEEHIRRRGGRHTILAPVYFMENLFNPWNLPALRAGRFPSPVPVELPLQQAAIADVASFAFHSS